MSEAGPTLRGMGGRLVRAHRGRVAGAGRPRGRAVAGARARRAFGTPAERATTPRCTRRPRGSAPAGGADRRAAGRSAGHLRALLGSAAVSLTGPSSCSPGTARASSTPAQAPPARRRGPGDRPDDVAAGCVPRPRLPRARRRRRAARRRRPRGRHPRRVRGRVGPGLVRAVGEVARWVAGQLELAELDESRARLAEAQVRALRAQISPHFVYNALRAIASFVRTDPERARELLLEFADFTRYSSRTHGEFTTLAEELRSIDRYLLLERARFGDRLQVTLRIAPEVLPVAVPYLCLQPLVENAVKHGLDHGRGTVTVVAEDAGGGVPHLGRGRRGRQRPRARAGGAGRHRPADAPGTTRWASATSTPGCARSTATTTAWSSRPRRRRHPGLPARAEVHRRGAGLVSAAAPHRARRRRRAAGARRAGLPAARRPAGGRVLTAGDAVGALRALEAQPVDAVFLDIRMPGLDGLELARVLARFAAPPRIVFVTAYDDAAVDAFALHATDYLLKPLRAARLSEAVRRVAEAGAARARGRPRAAGPRPSRSSSAASRASSPCRRALRRGAGRLRPPAHRDRQPPRPHPAVGARGPLGRRRVRPGAPLLPGRDGAHRRAAGRPGRRPRRVVGGMPLPVSRRHSRELKDRLVRRARRESGR